MKKMKFMDFSKKMVWNSRDLVDLYNDTASGHFFDKDTMRFFKSKVTDNFRRLSDTEALFITTEKGPTSDSKRMATLRIARIKNYTDEHNTMRSKVEIDTLGEFNNLTLHMARKFLNEYKGE